MDYSSYTAIVIVPLFAICVGLGAIAAQATWWAVALCSLGGALIGLPLAAASKVLMGALQNWASRRYRATSALGPVAVYVGAPPLFGLILAFGAAWLTGWLLSP